MADCVRMIRQEPAHPGGPTTAEVHPDEVAHWQAAGWLIDEIHGEAAEPPMEPDAKASIAAGEGQDAPLLRKPKKLVQN